MNCSFFTYESWEIQIIKNAIAFKKNYDKWPNFMIANPCTFDNCVAEIERVIEEGLKNGGAKNETVNAYDWNNFDINEPIDKYPIQSMPVKIDDGIFGTPLFSMLWLDSKSYQEDLYKLSFGTNPGPDDGEKLEIDDDEPIKIRKVA